MESYPSPNSSLLFGKYFRCISQTMSSEAKPSVQAFGRKVRIGMMRKMPPAEELTLRRRLPSPLLTASMVTES